jgi:hypothetical protein
MTVIEQNIKLTARVRELQADIAQAEVYLTDERYKVRELEAELHKHQWVSVEDRLPEGESGCRVYVLNDGMAIVGGYIPENDEWFYVQETGHFHSSGRIEKVTHWKPITLPTDIEKGN